MKTGTGRNVTRWLILGIALASACVLGLLGVTLTNTIRPQYCSSCHSMESAYQTWSCGTFQRVTCIECHTDTDTGIYLAREIDDRTCTKSGCHTRDKLFAKKDPYKDFGPFKHETHLKKWAYDRSLRCTACHASRGDDKHFGIDRNACYVCHFIRGEGEVEMIKQSDDPLWDCALCHNEVNKKIRIYDKEFEHTSFEKPGLDCNSCHFNKTVHGIGDIDNDSCYRCHDTVPEDYSSVDDNHYDHMAKHKVGCSPCHREIRHRMYTDIPEILKADLYGEMPARNPVYIKMMKGEGGRGVMGTPDPMYIATVSCSGCHKDNVKDPVDPEICNTCHDKGFETVLKEQMDLVRHRMSILKAMLEAARPAAGRGEAAEALETARHNYELITADGSSGAHNIKYVKDLLNLSMSLLENNRQS